MDAPELVNRIRQVLYDWDWLHLLDALQGASLDVWTEEIDVVVDEHLPPSFQSTVARVTVAIEHFDALTNNDVNVLADAVAEVIGPVDDFAVIQGDLPDEYVEAVEAAPRAATPSQWHGMMFRSKSEVAIAEALERANALFFPNARGRFGPTAYARESREPDFLVVYRGKFGVLEVDGATGTAAWQRRTMNVTACFGITASRSWNGSAPTSASTCLTTSSPSSSACSK